MIPYMFYPSPTGWLATYSDGTTLPVEAWHPDGDALVVNAQAGRLVSAPFKAGFTGLKEGARLIGVTSAAPDWLLRWDEKGDPFDTRIAAWIADSEGNLYPVCGSQDSYLTLSDDQSSIIPPPLTT